MVLRWAVEDSNGECTRAGGYGAKKIAVARRRSSVAVALDNARAHAENHCE